MSCVPWHKSCKRNYRSRITLKWQNDWMKSSLFQYYKLVIIAEYFNIRNVYICYNWKFKWVKKFVSYPELLYWEWSKSLLYDFHWNIMRFSPFPVDQKRRGTRRVLQGLSRCSPIKEGWILHHRLKTTKKCKSIFPL